ncbi:MAG: carboxylesterase family protein [Brevundimonas sp.]|nr:carboxylesterase family protein [Brevundimonas sp.]
MEGVVLSAMTIPSHVTEGGLDLQGGWSVEEAERLADLLDLGRPGNLVMEDVEPAFADGREAPVPLIIGTNSAEFWWMKPSDLSPYGALDDAMTAEERAAFLEAYGGQDGYDAHVLSDLVFNEPARHLARLHARNGHPTYLYRFDVVSAAMPEPHDGATHASERQYVFDNLTASPWPTAEMDQRQADAMAAYWTTFADGGDPNGGGRPLWPEFGAEPDRLLEFTNDGPAAKAVPFAERLDLIEAYYERVR